MGTKVSKPLLGKTEEYVVKFWITNEQGFKEQKEESAFFFSKGKHKQAEKEIVNKYRGKGIKISVISVIYQ